MEQIPTAEELLLEEIKKYSSPLTSEGLQLLVINVSNKHAENHVKAALKAASEDATTDYEPHWSGEQEGSTYINKDSILNAYPLNLIK